MKGMLEPCSSKQANIRAVALTSLLFIIEPEPIEATCTEKAWVAENIVDTIAQSLYSLESDQSDFELY
jgi:hypothetical protein